MADGGEFTRRAAAIGAALLPGAILGAHTALLLFFLNPRLDLGTATVARAVAVLALALGVAIGAPLSLLLRGRPERLLRALPWSITAALALAAIAQWSHAAHFAFYLPPGINLRLLKAATGVSAAALSCFYTALLHTLSKRRYGWRSRAGIALLTVLSLLFTAERRAAFSSPPAATATVRLRTQPSPVHLGVVAIEGATLDAVLPLAEQGQLPFVSTLLRQGVQCRLRTLSPPVRAAVWRSVATGDYPFRHGVVSEHTLRVPFLAPTPRLALTPWGSGFARWARPIGVRIEAVPPPALAPALWQILAEAGVETAVVGWPAANEEGPVRWLTESLFLSPDLPSFGTAATAAIAARVPVRALDPAVFEPLGAEAPESVKEALAGDLWRAAAARQLQETFDPAAPSALFVGLPGLLAVSRDAYGGYAAVHFDGAASKVQLQAAQQVSGYYTFLDRLLQRLWTALPEPRLLAVVSAHGVREPPRWRRLLSGISPERSLMGRVDDGADGLLLLLGENLRSGGRLDRSRLVDVAPTLLYAVSQPVARDLDGTVMTGSFGSSYLTRNPLTFVASYSPLAGETQSVRP